MSDVLSSVLTIPQQLAMFHEHTGLVFNIRPFERVLKVKLSDDGAAILVETYQTKQLVRGWRLLKKGTRLISYAPSPSGYKQIGVLDIWDEDFEPQTVAEIGNPLTIEDWIDRSKWERECYRYGDGNLAEEVAQYQLYQNC
jgi:hypothetical protein